MRWLCSCISFGVISSGMHLAGARPASVEVPQSAISRDVISKPASSSVSGAKRPVKEVDARENHEGDAETKDPRDDFHDLLKTAWEQSEVAVPVPHSKSAPALTPQTKSASSKAIGNTLPVATALPNNDALPLQIAIPIPATREKDVAKPTTAVANQVDAIAADPKPEEPVLKDQVGDQAFSARIRPKAESSFDLQAGPTKKEESPRVITPDPSPEAEVEALADNAPLTTTTLAPAATTVHTPHVTAQSNTTSVISTESIEATSKPSARSEPMRDISIQLPGARGVEVRLSERAGEIRVDVKSGDPALTQDLRGSLHELVSGLDRKGYNTEVSHPVESTSIHMTETSSSKESTSDGQSGGRQQDQQQQGRQQPFDQFSGGRSPKARSEAWNQAIDFNQETQS